jgi:hypothetical protein
MKEALKQSKTKDKLILIIHNLTSQFSQDYIRVLIWMVIFVLIYIISMNYNHFLNLFSGGNFDSQKYLNTFFYLFEPIKERGTGIGKLITLFFKGIFLFLGYQFIISIKRKVRNK